MNTLLLYSIFISQIKFLISIPLVPHFCSIHFYLFNYKISTNLKNDLVVDILYQQSQVENIPYILHHHHDYENIIVPYSHSAPAVIQVGNESDFIVHPRPVLSYTEEYKCGIFIMIDPSATHYEHPTSLLWDKESQAVDYNLLPFQYTSLCLIYFFAESKPEETKSLLLQEKEFYKSDTQFNLIFLSNRSTISTSEFYISCFWCTKEKWHKANLKNMFEPDIKRKWQNLNKQLNKKLVHANHRFLHECLNEELKLVIYPPALNKSSCGHYQEYRVIQHLFSKFNFTPANDSDVHHNWMASGNPHGILMNETTFNISNQSTNSYISTPFNSSEIPRPHTNRFYIDFFQFEYAFGSTITAQRLLNGVEGPYEDNSYIDTAMHKNWVLRATISVYLFYCTGDEKIRSITFDLWTEPFSTEIWILISLLIPLGVSLGLLLMKERMTFSNILIRSISILLRQGLNKINISDLLIIFASVLLSVLYECDFKNEILFPPSVKTFQDLKELIDNQYKICFIYGSAFGQGMLQYSDNFTDDKPKPHGMDEHSKVVAWGIHRWRFKENDLELNLTNDAFRLLTVAESAECPFIYFKSGEKLAVHTNAEGNGYFVVEAARRNYTTCHSVKKQYATDRRYLLFSNHFKGTFEGEIKLVRESGILDLWFRSPDNFGTTKWKREIQVGIMKASEPKFVSTDTILFQTLFIYLLSSGLFVSIVAFTVEYLHFNAHKFKVMIQEIFSKIFLVVRNNIKIKSVAKYKVKKIGK